MSGSNTNGTPRQGRGGRAPGFIPPSREQKLEKKLVASDKKNHTFPSEHIADLQTRITDNVLGKDSLIIRLGTEGGFTSQLAIHRAIGFDMKVDPSDWVMSPLSTIQQYKSNANNPFEAKTRDRVSKLKEDAALRLGLLKKDKTETKLLYPNSEKERAAELDTARKYSAAHNKVQGGQPLTPAFSYMDLDCVKEEIALLNGLATDEQLAKEVGDVLSDFLGFQTKSMSTGETQIAVPYLKGIPAKDVQAAVLCVMRTGKLDASYEALKTTEARKKEHQFVMWGYANEVEIPALHLNKLKMQLDEWLDAHKAYNASRPVGREAESKETNDEKKHRNELLLRLNSKTRDVNAAENFQKVLPKVSVTQDFLPKQVQGSA